MIPEFKFQYDTETNQWIFVGFDNIKTAWEIGMHPGSAQKYFASFPYVFKYDDETIIIISDTGPFILDIGHRFTQDALNIIISVIHDALKRLPNWQPKTIELSIKSI